MTRTEDYFREVERLGLGTRSEVLARVFHVDDDAQQHALSIIPNMDPDALRALNQLDLAVRVRNPGVHYVRRSRFLGYRREGATESVVGARSQIFLSVVPKKKLLKLVFVPPPGMQMPSTVEEIGERGHHGVGTHTCVVRTTADVDAFIRAFETFLRL
ncbi:hypothetical protein B4U78_008810 [Microbacterium esteraromaticum]|jgi:hypothetical protein|nr:hypothetical protein B4U78_008810 [Microbacterium esteraromaticum]